MKNKIVSKIILSLGLCFMFGNVQAGEVESTVVWLQGSPGGVFNSDYQGVEFADLPTGQPACATAEPIGRMVFRGNGNEGVALTNTILMTSLLEGRTVKAVGKGKCFADYEILNYVTIE